MAQPGGTIVQNQIPILTFSVGEKHYALPIDVVVEVAAMVEVIDVPESKPALLGVVNRHGTVLPLLDLRRIFQVPLTPIDVSTLFIVARYGQQLVGLVVDTVFQVEYIENKQIEATPAYGDYVQQIVSQGTKLIQLLALPPLVSRFLPDTLDEVSEE